MTKRTNQVMINDYPYEVDVVGDGQPTWLFLHGFLGGKNEFADIKPKGTVIYVTLKGFGGHAPVVSVDDLHVENQTQDLKLLLDELDIAKVHLVGYSMGARLALGFALAYPERVNHLVLESGTAGLSDVNEREARQAKDDKQAQRLIDEGMERFVDFWEALPLFATQDAVSIDAKQAVRNQRLQQVPANMAASLRGFGTGIMPNYWTVLKDLKLLTTIITGERDEKFTQLGMKLQQNIPNSQQFVVPETGHNVHLEAPMKYTELLNQLV